MLYEVITVNKFGQFNDYFSFFKCNDEEQQLVKGLIQNNYSLFFRNSLTFTVLEHVVIPSIIQYACQGNRKEIRIWSSACAIGQEPYSLAILFAEAWRNRITSYNVCYTKLLRNETEQDCLVREIKEELDITIKVDALYMENSHQYANKHILLKAFICTLISGDILLRDHDKMAWVTIDKLNDYRFA